MSSNKHRSLLNPSCNLEGHIMRTRARRTADQGKQPSHCLMQLFTVPDGRVPIIDRDRDEAKPQPVCRFPTRKGPL